MNKAFLQYIRIIWKRSLRCIPVQLLMTILLILTAAGLVAISSRFFYQDQIYQKQRVAVVFDSKEYASDHLIYMINQMKSVDNACSLERMEEKEAFEQLDRGQVLAVMVVPDYVIHDIMDGTNTPVQIFFTKEKSLERVVFRTLLESGASLLSAAQAQTYAVYDLATTAQALEFLRTYEREIDTWNLRLALGREQIFQRAEVSVFGVQSILHFYLSTAITCICMLWGIGAVYLLEKQSSQMDGMLRRAGVGRMKAQGVKLFVTSFWVFLMQYGILLAVGRTFPDGYEAVRLYIAALFISSLQVLVYSVCRQQTGVMMLLSLGTVALAFIAGGIVPEAFLPAEVVRIGQMTPAYEVLQILRSHWEQGEARMSQVHELRLLAWTLGNVLISVYGVRLVAQGWRRLRD